MRIGAERTPAGQDVVRALVPAAFVMITTTFAGRSQPGAVPLDVLGYLCLIAAALPLLMSRRFPVAAFAVSAICVLTYYWSGYPGGPAIVLPGIALFVLTLRRGPAIAAIAGGALVLALYLTLIVRTGQWVPDGAPAGGFLAGITAVIGVATAVRNRAEARESTRQRQDEQQRRQAEQERLRIAREVHDVVAHSLAMINVQAGVAAHVADKRPEQAKEALRNIKDASASALSDLRATLAVLRSGQDTAPAPSLNGLGELLDHARAAGLEVRLHGEPGVLPAPVDGAGYRILQESLTNVVRHATRARIVDVHFGQSDGGFELAVLDDGMGAREPHVGNGLRGMRERAEALGGRLYAGPASAGGFQVRVVLPVKGGPT